MELSVGTSVKSAYLPPGFLNAFLVSEIVVAWGDLSCFDRKSIFLFVIFSKGSLDGSSEQSPSMRMFFSPLELTFSDFFIRSLLLLLSLLWDFDLALGTNSSSRVMISNLFEDRCVEEIGFIRPLCYLFERILMVSSLGLVILEVSSYVMLGMLLSLLFELSFTLTYRLRISAPL